jgi:hypothetical protein
MKKLLAIMCSTLLALIVMDATSVKAPTGLTVAQVGKGKAPIGGKGKAPPPSVVTKG